MKIVVDLNFEPTEWDEGTIQKIVDDAVHSAIKKKLKDSLEAQLNNMIRK